MTYIGATSSLTEVDIGTVDTTDKAFFIAALDYNNNIVASAIMPVVLMQNGVYGYCFEYGDNDKSIAIFRKQGNVVKGRIASTTRSSITLRMYIY